MDVAAGFEVLGDPAELALVMRVVVEERWIDAKLLKESEASFSPIGVVCTLLHLITKWIDRRD